MDQRLIIIVGYGAAGKFFITMLTETQEVQQTAVNCMIWMVILALALVLVWRNSIEVIWLRGTCITKMFNTLLIFLAGIFAEVRKFLRVVFLPRTYVDTYVVGFDKCFG